jgi:hypothetical protein
MGCRRDTRPALEVAAKTQMCHATKRSRDWARPTPTPSCNGTRDSMPRGEQELASSQCFGGLQYRREHSDSFGIQALCWAQDTRNYLRRCPQASVAYCAAGGAAQRFQLPRRRAATRRTVGASGNRRRSAETAAPAERHGQVADPLEAPYRTKQPRR